MGYDRPDQLQRPRTPDLENSRKTAEKGAEWPPSKVLGKQPKNSRTAKQPKNSCFARFGCFSGCFSAVSPALYTRASRHLFQLFFGCFQSPAFGASVAGRSDRNSWVSFRNKYTWWTFRIFLIFSSRGGGRGSPRRQEEKGSVFFIENPQEGGGGFREGEGAEGPGGCLRRIGDLGGGGLKNFFRGRNVHQVQISRARKP